MPILLCPPPPSIAEVRPLYELCETPVAEGAEGRAIQDQVCEVMRHWRKRSDSQAITEDSDDIASAYSIVPMDDAGSVRVTYRYSGELEPMPYDLDD